MFASTLPAGEPEFMRVSDFRRYLESIAAAPGDPGPASTRLSSLSPSLMQDLLRFEHDGRAGDPLQVLAASLRHGRDLLMHLEQGVHVVPLTVFPLERLAHCPLQAEQLLAAGPAELHVLHVEPALLHAPGSYERTLVADAAQYMPLGPLSWELALRGGRETLLPELAGQVAYRVAPAADLRALRLSGTLAAAVQRLRRETTNLRTIGDWPGLDRERAARLLNALYLQAALMISRTHPAASNEGWRNGG